MELLCKKVLYIGGFALPDDNAAAHRVVGIAKGLRDIGCTVILLHSLKNRKGFKETKKSYFGFDCIEYDREYDIDYYFTAKTACRYIKRINPDVVIAYNYPAVALDVINRYCQKKRIQCFADATEWYKAEGKNRLFNFVKNFDSEYRMKHVHKKLNGIIAISRVLYDYYRDITKTVLIPPTVDKEDKKWKTVKNAGNKYTEIIYAGSPSAKKERLDLIQRAISDASEELNVHLTVIGINEKQYRAMYNIGENCKNVSFLGRIPNEEAVRRICAADWSVVLRERNSIVEAGFPTKVVESISCGTPVIANRFSNITDYLNEENSIILDNFDDFSETVINKACAVRLNVNSSIFDYRNYIRELRDLLSEQSH